MAPQRSRLAAYGWIERDGLVLLSKIAPGHDGAGHWTLPGGGVEWGEHPEQTVHRELREESGLDGEVAGFVGVDSITFEPNEHNGYTDLHAVRLIYRLTADGNPEVQEVNGSTVDAAWIPLDNLDDLPVVDLVTTARRLAVNGHVHRAAADR